MAGIWEYWQDAAGNEIRSCAIITTEAKDLMSQIHHRMPVHIAPADYHAWLDCSSEETDIADGLIQDTSPQYQYYAVDTTVNNSRNEGKDLIAPID